VRTEVPFETRAGGDGGPVEGNQAARGAFYGAILQHGHRATRATSVQMCLRVRGCWEVFLWYRPASAGSDRLYRPVRAASIAQFSAASAGLSDASTPVKTGSASASHQPWYELYERSLSINNICCRLNQTCALLLSARATHPCAPSTAKSERG
jgi:hypothetical protein